MCSSRDAPFSYTTLDHTQISKEGLVTFVLPRQLISSNSFQLSFARRYPAPLHRTTRVAVQSARSYVCYYNYNSLRSHPAFLLPDAPLRPLLGCSYDPHCSQSPPSFEPILDSSCRPDIHAHPCLLNLYTLSPRFRQAWSRAFPGAVSPPSMLLADLSAGNPLHSHRNLQFPASCALSSHNTRPCRLIAGHTDTPSFPQDAVCHHLPYDSFVSLVRHRSSVRTVLPRPPRRSPIMTAPSLTQILPAHLRYQQILSSEIPAFSKYLQAQRAAPLYHCTTISVS